MADALNPGFDPPIGVLCVGYAELQALMLERWVDDCKDYFYTLGIKTS